MILLLFLALILSGCIRRTLTEVPAFSGRVVDSNNGQPLDGVSIDKQFVTMADGQFAFPAVTKKIWNFPLPGAGQKVTRSLTFSKAGYRTTSCQTSSFALFSEPNIAVIPLLKREESEANPEAKYYFPLKDNDLHMSCQIFIGSRVEYRHKNYIVGNIFQDNGHIRPTLILWPALPNSGDRVIVVKKYYPHQIRISNYPER